MADKIPAVDSVNDVIQTLIRPTSGGLMFASAFGMETVSDSSVWAEPQTWIMLVLGCGVALAMHLMKSTTRPVINAGTVGVGAPVVSTAENVFTASLTAAAIFMPVLVLVLLVVVVGPVVWGMWKLRSRIAAHRNNAPAEHQ